MRFNSRTVSIIAGLENMLLPKGAKQQFTSNEFKRVMLTGYLSLIGLGTAVIYTLVDLDSGVYYALPNYVILFLTAIGTLIAIRAGRYTFGKVLLMAAGNLVVFYSAISDPIESGAFILFLPAGLGSFAILGFRQRIHSITLASFSILLFTIAYFSDLRTTMGHTTSAEYAQISFVMNYVLSLIISVLIVYFLISLNQQAEQALLEKEQFLVQQNEQLEKVNQELDRFVYSVSHDLRSPLSSILGLTNLAKRANTHEERQEYLSMIEGRIKVQDQFIHDIMEYSRNVRTHVSITEVNVTQLIREVNDGLRFVDGASRITFQIPHEEVVVRSDLHRLNVILSNLIGNAIKYHDLQKEGPYVKIDVKLDEDYLWLEIADNGHGIDFEHQTKVFDMFYRATELSKGSGLGLYIVKEAIAKLGGSIELNSVPREGTRFRVSLPTKNVA